MRAGLPCHVGRKRVNEGFDARLSRDHRGRDPLRLEGRGRHAPDRGEDQTLGGRPALLVQVGEEVSDRRRTREGKRIEAPAHGAAERGRGVTLAELEADALEDELNELGQERWEVFWVERTDQGLNLFLKRPTVSYLRAVPFSEIGRAVPGG